MATPSDGSRYDKIDVALNNLLNLIHGYGYELDVEDFGDSFDIDIYVSEAERTDRAFLYTLYSRER